MARLLFPSDYGIIAILMVFLSIMQLFIDGGFTTALIQKRERDEKDFSTVFTFNICLSIIAYFILFISAKSIASFYGQENLEIYLRVIALNLIISSFAAVQKTKLVINVDFKTLSKVSVFSIAISGSIGIAMAYNGKGIWALIVQSVCNTSLNTFLLCYFSKWFPKYFFNIVSFRRLFSFSSKLLLVGLVDKIYMNLYPLIIGKFFSSAKLGYYTRAEQFASLPSSSFSDILLRVSFPIIASISNDNKALIQAYKKYIVVSSYLVFPIMVLLIVLAYPIVLLLLTDKWIMIIPFMQILCVGFMFDHIGTINRNLLYAKGRSDLALKMEVVKKMIALLILMVSITFGIFGVCIGQAVYGITSVYLNSYYTKDMIGLSFYNQLKLIFPSLLLSAIMGGIIFLINSLFEDLYLKILIGLLTAFFVYAFLSSVSRNEAFYELISMVKCKIKKYN